MNEMDGKWIANRQKRIKRIVNGSEPMAWKWTSNGPKWIKWIGNGSKMNWKCIGNGLDFKSDDAGGFLVGMQFGKSHIYWTSISQVSVKDFSSLLETGWLQLLEMYYIPI
jgi:hypothetical protein